MHRLNILASTKETIIIIINSFEQLLVCCVCVCVYTTVNHKLPLVCSTMSLISICYFFACKKNTHMCTQTHTHTYTHACTQSKMTIKSAACKKCLHLEPSSHEHQHSTCTELSSQ